MREEEVKQLLQETEAILEGHFLLTSGLHSPLYVEKFNLLQWPKQTERLCKELAERFADAGVEVVIGPMTGGILLAHEVGKALETRAIFTERENGAMALRRGVSYGISATKQQVFPTARLRQQTYSRRSDYSAICGAG